MITVVVIVASIAVALVLVAVLVVLVAPWALARIAEGRRRALLVRAEGEFAASARLAEAAKVLGQPGLELRRILVHTEALSRDSE